MGAENKRPDSLHFMSCGLCCSRGHGWPGPTSLPGSTGRSGLKRIRHKVPFCLENVRSSLITLSASIKINFKKHKAKTHNPLLVTSNQPESQIIKVFMFFKCKANFIFSNELFPLKGSIFLQHPGCKHSLFITELKS